MLTDSSDCIKVLEGENKLCLECDVQDPIQSVSWLKDGGNLRDGFQMKVEDTKHILDLPKVLMEDSGTYTVCINNRQRQIKITVEGKL